jgi:hypothetical protein
MNRFDDNFAVTGQPSARRGGRSVVLITGAFAAGIGLGLCAVYALRTMRDSAQATAVAAAPVPAKSSLDTPANVPVDEEALAALVSELTTGETTPAVKPQSAKSTRSKPSGPANGKRTLEFWNALNAVMEAENGMRTAPANITAGNAQAFVAQRAQAFDFASRSIAALDTRGVDAEVVAIGREIADWYKDGITANANAQHLLSQANEATRKGAAGKSWRGSEEQHRLRCLEINRQGAELRERMSAKYGEAFPPLK